MGKVREQEFINRKYNLDPKPKRLPVEIPNVGREDLARLFAELDYRTGVEVGVWQGEFNETLCKENPQAKIYGVDPWHAYEEYWNCTNELELEGYYKATQIRLLPYDNYELIREFSLEAVKDFDDKSLDFVYIDGNHTLPFVINELIQWGKKVRIGGIISGHDYIRSKRFLTQNHVVYAVNCYTRSYRINPWYLLGSKAMIPGKVRDKERSFMWVKRW